MREELKPCPFCGGQAILIQVGEKGKDRQYRVICPYSEDDDCGCGGASGYHDNIIDAIKAWNRRWHDTDDLIVSPLLKEGRK